MGLRPIQRLRRRMRATESAIKIAGIAAAVGPVVFLAVAYEVALWRECLVDHAVFYCMRVLG